jgi:hypothetical protein
MRNEFTSVLSKMENGSLVIVQKYLGQTGRVARLKNAEQIYPRRSP